MLPRLLPTIVLVMATVAAACGGPQSATTGRNVEADDVTVEAVSMDDTTPAAPSEPLVIEVDRAADTSSETATTGATTPGSSVPPTTTATATTTTAAAATTTTTTTTAPATTATAASSTTTAATATTPASTSTTAAVTTSAPSARTETRDEILRLALPKFGGGSFDPDSVAGKDIVLWFWGAH